MMTSEDVAKVYDTILSGPGMNELVKVDVKISRKNVLLLSEVMHRGLNGKADDKQGNLLGLVSEADLQEMKSFTDECLQKAGLNELSEKLKTLNAQK